MVTKAWNTNWERADAEHLRKHPDRRDVELPSSKENKFHLNIEYARKKFDTSKMSLLKVA